MKLERTIKYETYITPSELAQIFSEYDSEEQVLFFNDLAMIMNGWGRHYVFQLENIRQGNLTEDARKLMKEIGNYSHD